MSERDRYEHGTPCWIDHASNDPEASAAFYRALFGWATEEQMPPDAPGSYLICRLRDRDVAAIGSQQSPDAPPAWSTYVAVESADDAAARASAAGGRILGEPFDVFDAGRMAVLADPSGAPFCVWQAGSHIGARLVNEPGALAWNELDTRDAEGAERFYGAVFGWRANAMELGGNPYCTWHLPTEGELDPQTAVGGMMPMVGDQWPPDLPPHWLAYFAVADTDATAARCRELGGTEVVAPFDTPAGRMTVLNDPVGAVFAVITMPTS